jgi:hypothetical protein
MTRHASSSRSHETASLAWHDSMEDGMGHWGAIGSAVLYATAGLYWAVLWIVGGFAPLGFLATHLRQRSAGHPGSDDL